MERWEEYIFPSSRVGEMHAAFRLPVVAATIHYKLAEVLVVTMQKTGGLETFSYCPRLTLEMRPIHVGLFLSDGNPETQRRTQQVKFERLTSHISLVSVL